MRHLTLTQVQVFLIFFLAVLLFVISDGNFSVAEQNAFNPQKYTSYLGIE